MSTVPYLAADWWYLRDKQVVCTLCPRECSLHEGQRGFCFVRQNIQNQMVLTTYGRSSGFCIDPIEKKPLNHFLPGTPVLSFGTAGCNLGCKFCQNWSISKAKEFDDRTDFASPEDIAQAAVKHGCRSVAFTYNDPVVWAEYAIDTAKACHALGLKTVAVTAGYISPEARGPFYRHMDAANVDLKGFTSDFYKHITLSKLEPVLDTIRWLRNDSNVWFEITNLLIPNENDSPDETSKMCDWIVENIGPDVPIHFTAFHPDFRMRDTAPTPASTLQRAREIAMAAGIRYAYVGNIHDIAGQSTRCHQCQHLLIERDYYQLGTYELRDGRCRHCRSLIPGVFENTKGEWGPRRMPIRISPVAMSINLNSSKLELNSPPLPPVAQTSPPQEVSNMSSNPLKWLSSVFMISSGGVATDSGHTQFSAKGDQKVVLSSSGVPEQDVTQDSTAVQPGGVPFLKTEFSISEGRRIVEFARLTVMAAVQGKPLPYFQDELSASPTYGIFVTLRMEHKLRACKGMFGGVTPLGEILRQVAADSALNDPRFSPVHSSELSKLQIEVSLMFNPRELNSTGIERAREIQLGRHGLVIHHPQGRGLLLPQVASEQKWDVFSFLTGLCRKASLPSDAWQSPEARLLTFEARIFRSDPVSASELRIRPAALPGRFYPVESLEIREQIKHYLASAEPGLVPRSYRAVMVPHAGWMYCGPIIGRTLARTIIPPTVIIVGPKHTPLGPAWSVSNADYWETPGAKIAVDCDLRARLVKLLPQLLVEDEAHVQEHCVEVLLPFLHLCNPDVRIVPVVLGNTSYSQTQVLAQALAIICRELDPPPLLVISSDMNHFATDSENRRLDQLALEAMTTGQGNQLFEVVQANQISMCGVIPAVTVLRCLEMYGQAPQPEIVCYDTSASTSGSKDRVVGYAGVVIP